MIPFKDKQNSYTYFNLEDSIGIGVTQYPDDIPKSMAEFQVYNSNAYKSQRNYNSWNTALNKKYPEISNTAQYENLQAAAASILSLPEDEREEQKKYFYEMWNTYVGEVAGKVVNHPRSEEILKETPGFLDLTVENLAKLRGADFGRTYTRGQKTVTSIGGLGDPNSVTLQDVVDSDTDLALGFVVNAAVSQGLFAESKDVMSLERVGEAAKGIIEEGALETATGVGIVKYLKYLKNFKKSVENVGKVSKIIRQVGKGAERVSSGPIRKTMAETIAGGVVFKGTGTLIPQSDYTAEEAAIHLSLETVLSGGIAGIPKFGKALKKFLPEAVKYLRVAREGLPENLTAKEYQNFKMLYEVLGRYAAFEEFGGSAAQRAETYLPKPVKDFLEETGDLYKVINSAYRETDKLNRVFSKGTKRQVQRHIKDNVEILDFADSYLRNLGTEEPFLKGRHFKKRFSGEGEIADAAVEDFLKRWELETNIPMGTGVEEFGVGTVLGNTAFSLWRNGVLSSIEMRVLEPLTAMAIYGRKTLARGIGALVTGSKDSAQYLFNIKLLEGIKETFSFIKAKKPTKATLKEDGLFVSLMDVLNELKVSKGLVYEPTNVARGENPLDIDRILPPTVKYDLVQKLRKLGLSLEDPSKLDMVFNNLTELHQFVTRTIPSVTDVLSEGFALPESIYHFGRVFKESLEKSGLRLKPAKIAKASEMYGEYADIMLRQNGDKKLLNDWELRFKETFTGVPEQTRKHILNTIIETTARAEQDVATITVKRDLLSQDRPWIVNYLGRVEEASRKVGNQLTSLAFANTVGAFMRSGVNLLSEGLQLFLPADALKKLRQPGVARQEAIGELTVTAGFWGLTAELYKRKLLKKDEKTNTVLITTEDGDINIKRQHPTLHTALNAVYMIYDTYAQYEKLKPFEITGDDTIQEFTPVANALKGVANTVIRDSFLRTLENSKYSLQAEDVSPYTAVIPFIANMSYTPFDTILDLMNSSIEIDGTEYENAVANYLGPTDSIREKLTAQRVVLEESGKIPPLEPKYNVKGEPIEKNFNGLFYTFPSKRERFEEFAQEYNINLQPTNLRSVTIPGSKQRKKLPREFNRLVAEKLRNLPPESQFRDYTQVMNYTALILEDKADSDGRLNPIFAQEELKRAHNTVYKYANDMVLMELGISEDVALTELEIFKRAAESFGVDYDE